MNIFLNTLFALHDGDGEMHHGKQVPCFENPSRMRHIINVLKHKMTEDFLAVDDYGLAPILAVHDKAYVDFLQNIHTDWLGAGNTGDVVPYLWPVPGLKRIAHTNIHAQVGFYAFSSDTPIMKGTWQAAYQGVQTALSALDHIMKNKAHYALSLSRPPGHHAHRANYGGYCFLNNAAICAQQALNLGANKVAILDVDFHHGNGTQDIFYDRCDVLHVSIHGDPQTNFPYYLGFADETGKDKGLGYNLNLPLIDGSDMKIWQQAFKIAEKRVNEMQADILIVPLGVDTFVDDPISNFTLTSDDFITMGKMIASLGLPTLFTMEGGYDVEPIGLNVYNVIAGFEEQRSP